VLTRRDPARIFRLPAYLVDLATNGKAACLLRMPVYLFALLAIPCGVDAHHSRAAYSGDIMEIEGELVDFVWRNPHPRLTVRSFDRGKGEILWQVEGWGSVYALQRSGVDRKLFVIGDRIRLAGYPSTLREQDFLGTHALLANGTEVVLRRDAEPYWSERHIGSKAQWRNRVTDPVDTRAENRGIFRVWSYPSAEFATRMHTPLNEAGRKKKSEWNPSDNYLTRCEQKGMPSSMVTPHPYEFIDEGNTIRIRGYEFDVERIVYMDNAPDPEQMPPDRQGFSTGYWEGDTLVIRTTRIDWPYYDMFGSPMSGKAEVTERYTLSEDQSRLDFYITTVDPVYFTETATMEYYWIALGETFGSYECKVY